MGFAQRKMINMKISVKFNFIAGTFILLSGAALSASMYYSGGYKAENAHVPLIMGLIGFLFILIIPIVPIVLRVLIKHIIESKLFFSFIIIHSVCFGISQLYFNIGFVNGIILSLIASLPALLLFLIVSKAFGDKYQPIKPNGPLNMKAVRDFEKAIERAEKELKRNKKKNKNKNKNILTDIKYSYLSDNIYNIDSMKFSDVSSD
jgi:uncharacterized membrane protein YdcZ (DUF606 family)